jgi:translation initiation factor IF-2
MDRVRIQEIASEAGASNAVLIEKAKELGYDVKAGNSTLTIEEADILVNYVINGIKPKKEEKVKIKKKIVVKKHAGIVSTPKRAKVSTIREVKKEKAPKLKEKKEVEIKSVNRSEKIEVTKEPLNTSKIKSKPKKESPKIKKAEKEVSKEPTAIKKPKVKRKRVGITVIKKVDREKPKIRIVNERKPEKEKEIQIVKKSKTKGMPTPPSKKKTKRAAQAKDSGEKLDFMTHVNFENSRTSVIEIEEEPEVMMLDFSDKNIYEDMMRQEQKRKEEAKKRAALGIGQQQTRNIGQHKRKPSGLRRGGKKKKYVKEESREQIKSVQIPENVRVHEFAEKVGRSTGEVIKVLFTLGTKFTQNDFLDKDSIEILADEFDIEVTTIDPLDALDYVKAYDAIEDKNPTERPPVITIMGHVDHGKTSLLDRIRKTKVATKEAGGITQHVGAYQVEKNGKKISFIDTPGHSAFTEMRSRGAHATDIVIVVVAADDGVKKQTKEAISHAKAADVPIVVAINKIDKESANPELVKSQLTELGITPVEWGGENEFIEVSAHTGQGIDELLETLLLTAEVMELTADANRNAKAIVVESSVEKGFGSVADVIVQNGTLKVGDSFVVGTTYGKVKTMILDDGTRAKSIGPSTPAAIVGLSKVPTAGDILIVMDSEKEAREIADKRAEYERAKELSKSQKVTLEDLSAVIAEGNLKSLPVIIKTDVQGSLEAIKGSLAKLKNEEVKVNIIHEGVGGVSESDVQLANASEHAIILGFNVRPTGSVKKRAKELGVEIKTYSVIFELIDDIKALLSGMMSPVISEEVTGQAEVRETFIVAKVGTIAGCKVSDGAIIRNAGARLIRDGVVIYTTKISSLKRFNDDVREVKSGFECGIMLEKFNDIKEGDVIETFKVIEEQVTL